MKKAERLADALGKCKQLGDLESEPEKLKIMTAEKECRLNPIREAIEDMGAEVDELRVTSRLHGKSQIS